MSDDNFTFDAVIGPPHQAGFTEDGNAVCLSFKGMIRDVPGEYMAAVLTPALPTVVAMLLSQAGPAQAARAASGSATPKPLALQCSAATVEGTTEATVRLILQLAPDVALHVDVARGAAQALLSGLSSVLAS